MNDNIEICWIADFKPDGSLVVTDFLGENSIFQKDSEIRESVYYAGQLYQQSLNHLASQEQQKECLLEGEIHESVSPLRSILLALGAPLNKEVSR